MVKPFYSHPRVAVSNPAEINTSHGGSLCRKKLEAIARLFLLPQKCSFSQCAERNEAEVSASIAMGYVYVEVGTCTSHIAACLGGLSTGMVEECQPDWSWSNRYWYGTQIKWNSSLPHGLLVLRTGCLCNYIVLEEYRTFKGQSHEFFDIRFFFFIKELLL